MIDQTSDLILTHAASPISMGDFRREFLALYDPPMAAKNTRDKYRQVLDLVEGLGVVSTADLVPELVARFIAGRPPGQSPFTVRGLLMSLRTICNYAEGRRYLVISPFRLRKLSRWVRVAPPAGKRHLSREEVRRILDVMRGDIGRKRGWAQWRARRLYAVTSTIAYTGLRRNEALFLWVEDVNLEHRAINLVPRGRDLPDPSAPAPRLKTELAAKPVALPAALVPILADWMAHRLDHPEGFPIPPVERIPFLFPGSRRTSAWSSGAPASAPSIASRRSPGGRA